MENLVRLYPRSDVDMVQVRKYCGVEDGQHAWIFEGYDFVVKKEEGKAVSLLARDEEYDYLPKIDKKGDVNYGKFDHTGILPGDIRIVSVGEMYPNRSKIVSVTGLKKWISENPSYSFLHYSGEKGKIKTIGIR